MKTGKEEQGCFKALNLLATFEETSDDRCFCCHEKLKRALLHLATALLEALDVFQIVFVNKSVLYVK